MVIDLLQMTYEELDRIIEWVSEAHGYEISKKNALEFAIHTSVDIPIGQEIDKTAKRRVLTSQMNKGKRVSINKRVEKKFQKIKKLSGEFYIDNTILAAAIVSFRVATLPKLRKGNRINLASDRRNDQHSSSNGYRSKIVSIMSDAKSLLYTVDD